MWPASNSINKRFFPFASFVVIAYNWTPLLMFGVLRNNNTCDGDVAPCPHVPAGLFVCNAQMHGPSIHSIPFHSIQSWSFQGERLCIACGPLMNYLSIKKKKTDIEGKEHFSASVWKQGSSCVCSLWSSLWVLVLLKETGEGEVTEKWSKGWLTWQTFAHSCSSQDKCSFIQR